MSGFKDFWAMTRRERRGTIVVLSVIAILLALTVVERSCHAESARTVLEQEMSAFEADVDTTEINVDKQQSFRKHKSEKKKHHKRSAKKPKREKHPQQPRRVDPVPQF